MSARCLVCGARDHDTVTMPGGVVVMSCPRVKTDDAYVFSPSWERFAKRLDVYATRVVAEERELMWQGAIEPIWPGPEPEPMEGDDDERSDDSKR